MSRPTLLWTSLACCLALGPAAYGDSVESAKTSKLGQRLPPAGEIITFKNTKSDRCIGVDQASMENGALVKQFECDGKPNQKWRVVGQYALQNVKSGKCMGVDRASVDPGANIGQYNCDGDGNDIKSNQSWTLLGLEGSMVRRIINKKSTLHHGNRRFCVGVDKASEDNGAQLKQFPCDDISLTRPSNQGWQVMCLRCTSPS